MTANAMVGDREKALDAGMNDHVAKPIDVAEMFKVLTTFHETRATAAQRIREALDAGDQSAAERETHKLTGVAGDAGRPLGQIIAAGILKIYFRRT